MPLSAQWEGEPRTLASTRVADPRALEMPSREAATPCIEGCNPVPQQAADACRLRPHGLRVGGAWLLGPSRQARC